MYKGHKVHKLIPAVWDFHNYVVTEDIVAPLDVHTALTSLQKKSCFEHVACTAMHQ